MKKFLAILLVMLLSLCVFVACDNAGTDTSGGTAVGVEGDLKIGLSMQTQSAPYFVAQAEAFKAACEAKGYGITVVDANGDVTKQQQDIEDLVAQGCNVIVVNPVDATGTVAAVNNTMAQGIPVFIMDNSIDASANYISMVQSDNFAIGTMLGDWLGAQFGIADEIRIGFLSGNVGNQLGTARRIGVIKGLTEYQLVEHNKTNFRVLTQFWGGWNKADGQAAAEDMLQAAPDINVLFAENDSMALGALAVINELGRDDIIIIGFDGEQEALNLIAEGGAYGATGFNDPSACAKKTLETIELYVNSGSAPGLVNTETNIVTVENAKDVTGF